ncbi:MAG: Coenzyme F420 hydrogenase/dehydrogenase, beta subunit C-terminal domain [Planctomycetota bacterium]|jgi:acetyltransferase-like isoleucine patch superfamily enzyme/coenzyme F420-reducing hydrogenase beta subunit
MIQIKDQKDCCGCNACFAGCPQKCITMKEDHEGFLYPEVQLEKCIDCGLCERVCPILKKTHLPTYRLRLPQVFAAWNTDKAVRLDSTSGGVFSALAEKMFEINGFVAGAVYLEDHTVAHIVTNDRLKLDEIRSSKYLQSYTGDLFTNIKQLLDGGDKVLVCGTPCQIRAVYSFMRTDYENLITCDFICRGINSPKVFLKYMAMLECQYGARATKIKFKNKTYGWHRFATRIDFANGKTYIKDRYHDPFMRGYLATNSFVRPSCYACRFKGMPCQADITLADFWGIEKIQPKLDNDCGTSLVLLNSEKGIDFFRSIGNQVFTKEFTMQDAVAENPALVKSLELKPSRDQFFNDLDVMSFAELAKIYFPVPGGLSKFRHFIIERIKVMARKFWNLYRLIGCSPSAWGQLIYINLVMRNTRSKVKIGFIPTRYCSVMVDRSAQIELNERFVLGWKQFRKSRIETRLYLGKNASLIVNGSFNVYNGSDIRVYPGGILTLNGGFCNDGVQITCGKKITIGKSCSIAREVIIRDYDAHQLLNSEHEIAKEINIGDHVWIGNRAIILKGVTIGNGAVIAAGAIVTKDVPEKCLAAGIPAKVIRENVKWE